MDEPGKLIGGTAGGGGPAGETGNAGGDIVGAIGGLVGGHGGLEGLVNQLGQSGLGDAVSSWVGTGPNKAVDPQHLAAALGPEKVEQLASKSGLPVETLMPILAGALPSIVDAATPDGKVTKGDATAGFDIGGMLQGLGGGAGGAGLAAGRPGRSAGRQQGLTAQPRSSAADTIWRGGPGSFRGRPAGDRSDASDQDGYSNWIESTICWISSAYPGSVLL